MTVKGTQLLGKKGRGAIAVGSRLKDECDIALPVQTESSQEESTDQVGIV